MELVVIPNIENESDRQRAQDELPQSAAGRTIMTTEPKFVPNQAVSIEVDEGLEVNIRLVDCVDIRFLERRAMKMRMARA